MNQAYDPLISYSPSPPQVSLSPSVSASVSPSASISPSASCSPSAAPGDSEVIKPPRSAQLKNLLEDLL